MCFGKKSSTPITSEIIVQQGVDGLQAYADAGVVLVNAGASTFKESGAQAIFSDGTKSPIFRKGSNTQEKRNLLAYLNQNYSHLLEVSATDLTEDETTVTTDEETGDVTVTTETTATDENPEGLSGSVTFNAADTETVEGLNDAIEALQSEIDALKGQNAAATEAAVAAALAAQEKENERIRLEQEAAAAAAAKAEAEAAAAQKLLDDAKAEAERLAAEEATAAAIKAAEDEAKRLQAELDAAKAAAEADAAALAAAQAAAEKLADEAQRAEESGAVVDTTVDSAVNQAYVDAAIEAALKEFTTKSGATQFSDVDTLTEGESTLLNPDIKTLNPVKPVGITSVVYKTIVQREPSEAAKLQEQVAREELRRARVDRAIQKRSLMRRRIESSAQVGAGRIVRSGTETELDVGQPSAPITRATGMRGGRGRGSLISGSRGGIGFYSRFS